MTWRVIWIRNNLIKCIKGHEGSRSKLNERVLMRNWIEWPAMALCRRCQLRSDWHARSRTIFYFCRFRATSNGFPESFGVSRRHNCHWRRRKIPAHTCSPARLHKKQFALFELVRDVPSSRPPLPLMTVTRPILKFWNFWKVLTEFTGSALCHKWFLGYSVL